MHPADFIQSISGTDFIRPSFGPSLFDLMEDGMGEAYDSFDARDVHRYARGLAGHCNQSITKRDKHHDFHHFADSPNYPLPREQCSSSGEYESFVGASGFAIDFPGMIRFRALNLSFHNWINKTRLMLISGDFYYVSPTSQEIIDCFQNAEKAELFPPISLVAKASSSGTFRSVLERRLRY